MLTLTRFHTPEEAHLFRCYLESHEVPAYVYDEHTVQSCWNYTLAIGGVRVAVDDTDATEAFTLLKEYHAELHDGEDRFAHGANVWPLALFFSIYGLPPMLFGRKKPPEIPS